MQYGWVWFWMQKQKTTGCSKSFFKSIFCREAVPKITSSVEQFKAWSVISTWLYLMPTFTNRFVSLTDFLFVLNRYKLLKGSPSWNVHVCSIHSPSCPASASGCAATRGSTGYCRAWTCQNCRRQPSWSPKEPACWWGDQPHAAAVTTQGSDRSLWYLTAKPHVCVHRLPMSVWLQTYSAPWRRWKQSTSDECPRCQFMGWLSQHRRLIPC